MQNLQDRRRSKKFIPRLFGAKKKRICSFQNLQEQTGSKKCSPTRFGSKKKRTWIFQNGIKSKIKQTKKLPNFLVLKWNGPKYSKIFSRSKWNKPNCSNSFQIEVERTKLFQTFFLAISVILLHLSSWMKQIDLVFLAGHRGVDGCKGLE